VNQPKPTSRAARRSNVILGLLLVAARLAHVQQSHYGGDYDALRQRFEETLSRLAPWCSATPYALGEVALSRSKALQASSGLTPLDVLRQLDARVLAGAKHDCIAEASQIR
jgi:hypothetical protein